MSFITSPSTKRWMQILTIIEREQVFKVGILSERLAISQRTIGERPTLDQRAFWRMY